MVVPAWNSSTLEAEAGDCCEFEAILGYILRPHFGAWSGVGETERQPVCKKALPLLLHSHQIFIETYYVPHSTTREKPLLLWEDRLWAVRRKMVHLMKVEKGWVM